MKFHADYLKARAVYYDNIMVFPDLDQNIGKASSTEAEETKDVDSGDGQPEAIESESNPSKPNTTCPDNTNTLPLVN